MTKRKVHRPGTAICEGRGIQGDATQVEEMWMKKNTGMTRTKKKKKTTELTSHRGGIEEEDEEDREEKNQTNKMMNTNKTNKMKE